MFACLKNFFAFDIETGAPRPSQEAIPRKKKASSLPAREMFFALVALRKHPSTPAFSGSPKPLSRFHASEKC
jgi:hypothetical protein